jgi:hypothetical protein
LPSFSAENAFAKFVRLCGQIFIFALLMKLLTSHFGIGKSKILEIIVNPLPSETSLLVAAWPRACETMVSPQVIT